MGHGRRQLLWFAVIRQPTAAWLAEQIVEAFPWGTAPSYLIRDNDGTYGADLHRPTAGNGNSGSPDIAEIALAERIRGAPDRDTAARLSGSCADLWQTAFAAGSNRVLDLLQRDAHASWIEQGRASTRALSSDLEL
jgi:hypothetical protein